MATHCYTVLVEKENGGYRAHCPALPGCRSYGDTKKEAVNNIKFSISYRLETLKAKGKPIPKRRRSCVSDAVNPRRTIEEPSGGRNPAGRIGDTATGGGISWLSPKERSKWRGPSPGNFRRRPVER